MINIGKKNKYKPKKRLKKIVILFSLLGLLITGFYHDYKTANAVAPALDLLGNVLLELSMYCAGLAAGEKKDDVVQPNPFFGTDDPTINNARDNYVKECFPSDTFKIKLGFDDDQYYRFLAGMGAVWAKANQILVKDYCNRIWDALPTDGSSALKPEDVVLDNNNATILQFPNLKPDEDGGEDEEPEPEEPDLSDNKLVKIFNADELSLSPSIFSLVFTTKFFNSVHNALISQNGTKMEESLDGTSEECDYSVAWWNENPVFINALFENMSYEFRFKNFENVSDLKKTYVYPLVFKDEKYYRPYYYGFASSDYFNLTVSASFFNGSWRGINLGDSLKYAPYTIEANGQWKIQNIWGSRAILNGTTAYVKAPNVIDVGTRENYEKFCDMVRSGDYTLDQLLDLMEKGWQVGIKNKEKQWEGIKNKGKTAKDTLEDPQKGTKYQTKTGNVNLESLDKGVQTQIDPKHGQPLYDFLGDPTKGTDLELDPNPGLNPNPGTNPNPGVGTESAGSNAGVIGSAFPDVGTSWWGQNYAPSNDPDSGKKPGIDDNNSGDGSNNEDDKKRPIVPGYIDGNDSNASNIQWYERFPFCIPWDIYRFITVLGDEPIKPKWNIPIKLPKYNINEKIVIDLTDPIYENLVKILRIFTLVSYGFGLVLISRNIIRG